MKDVLTVFAIVMVGLTPFILFLFGDLVSKVISNFWLGLLTIVPLAISSVFGMLGMMMYVLRGYESEK
ncbi:hypothetical protein O3795_00025 [Haemophilus parahaemolyticus]|uniref:hypothetical protein n=1 Tax=Haemophilus parahaemolyticus TaxID=735 RepID=UPI00058EABDE|nr:hypothetical protein [Haemophilus parahaemolyticus]